MAILTDPVKLFITKAVACFDTPAEVAAAVSEEFGITIQRQQVELYDPTKAKGRDLSKKLRAVFETARKEFLEESAKVLIANRVYRLRKLQRSFEIAMGRKNIPLAAQLLEQAAKEVGGMFTNRREHSGPGGQPIPVAGNMNHEHLHKLSDADLERFIAAAATAPSDGR